MLTQITIEELNDRFSQYTQYCNQCAAELPENPVRVDDWDNSDDECMKYHYFCSEMCATSFFSHQKPTVLIFQNAEFKKVDLLGAFGITQAVENLAKLTNN